MKTLKAALLKPFWRLFGRSESRYTLPTDTKPCIVVGFQRSGTSLICDLLHTAGVYFGEPDELMTPDSRNPRGFFEHNTIFKLSRKFLRQAGCTDDLTSPPSLRARGFFNKIRRYFTRIAMLRALHELAHRAPRWGFKNFPLFFYFWKRYVPKPVMIGVYRDPYTVAESFMTAWPSRYRFEDILNLWTDANNDLLYHTITTNGMLIKYEDLFDATKARTIIEKLVERVGTGSVDQLLSVISPALNRSNAKAEALRAHYPLPTTVSDILTAFDRLKV